jgi:DNA-binding CsgD family transcriptional regulator
LIKITHWQQLNAKKWIKSMRAYGNILFSFYCNDLFFKKGLCELIDGVFSASNSKDNIQNNLIRGSFDDYYWIDIVVLSSKSIFEKLPKRARSFGDESHGVILFCSENMMHVVKGVNGYENAIFFTDKLNVLDVKRAFANIIFGGSARRREIFENTKLAHLTNRERLVSELLRKGMSQKQISQLTGINVKTVSSHLRSAMSKYNASNLLEYRIKLLYINEVR